MEGRTLNMAATDKKRKMIMMIVSYLMNNINSFLAIQGTLLPFLTRNLQRQHELMKTAISEKNSALRNYNLMKRKLKR